MSLSLAIDPSPLRLDETGVIRIGPTRVTLDTFVAVFSRGATPEQIVQDFPSLDLADVYAAAAYYLRHREELEEYLSRRRQEAEAFARENAGLYATGVRERLLARQASRDVPNAPISGG